MKLLLVDTDRALVEMLTGWLKTLGYEVHRAYAPQQAKSKWVEHQPDLVILDTAFQDVDVLALCRELRNIHDALVIVITDSKDVQDEIRCLESGVDDYLRKPFYPAQLLARIHAASRRARSSLEQRPPSIITVGPIRVDFLHNEVRVHGKTVRLTPTESKLLHLLAVNRDQVCTTSQIVTYVWGYDGDGDHHLIKAHIRHLRLKIESKPEEPRYILTVSGVGYTLVHHPTEEYETQMAS